PDLRLGDVVATATDIAFTLSTARETAAVRLPLPGRQNAWHAAAAATVGLVLGIPLADAARALAQATGVKGRLVWREAGGVHILDDTYNANPTSLRAALDVLAAARAAASAGAAAARPAPMGPPAPAPAAGP